MFAVDLERKKKNRSRCVYVYSVHSVYCMDIV